MQKITFHSFSMGDVEDPELYAAQPLYEWQQTEQGQWVMEHCSDPQYIVRADVNAFGHKIIVYGNVEDQLATEYLLKWGR
jgi:hypothetical protein